MTLARFAGILVLAILEGATVALPGPQALLRLRRLRSPAWAALLPGSILIGTFGVVRLPEVASGLVVAAAVATPLLMAVTLIGVVPGGRPPLLWLAGGLVLFGALRSGWMGQVCDSGMIALGCVALGVALVRLIPRRWLLVGVISMCLVDVLLLALGVGENAMLVMNQATAHFPRLTLDQARVGPVATDYPDFVLAAVLGGFLAEDPRQRVLALSLTILVALYGMLLPVAGALPATVPTTVLFVLLIARRDLRGMAHRARRLRGVAHRVRCLRGEVQRACRRQGQRIPARGVDPAHSGAAITGVTATAGVTATGATTARRPGDRARVPAGGQHTLPSPSAMAPSPASGSHGPAHKPVPHRRPEPSGKCRRPAEPRVNGR